VRNDAHADSRSTPAEQVSEFGPDTQIYAGPQSREALAELLGDRPASDADEVTRRLRGRPNLDRNARPGVHSKQLNVRIGHELGTLVQLHLAHDGARTESELVRKALSEYFDRHQLPSY
jgi:hypothetical protein